MSVKPTEPWVLDDPTLIDRLEDDGMFEAVEEIRSLQMRFQHFAERPLITAAPDLLDELVGAANTPGPWAHLLGEFSDWPDSELVQLCLAPVPGEHGGEQVVAATLGQLRRASAPDLLEALEKAEAAIARVTEGDGGMTVKTAWRADGAASKNDQCRHGRSMYEGCETCVAAVLDPVLDDIIRPALARARGQ